MNGAMTIGQLARAAGVGVETIRYYERLGLIQQPKPLNGAYRRYGAPSLVMLRYIRLAKGMGLSLKDVSALQGRLAEPEGFCAAVRAAVAERRRAVEAEIAELAALRDRMDGFLACAATSHAGLCPTSRALMGSAA